MSANGLLQIILFLTVVLLLVKPLGFYMAYVYEGKLSVFTPFRRIEESIYGLCGIQSHQEMNWRAYLVSLLIFNFLGIVIVYIIQRCQIFLPFNPEGFAGVAPDLAFNTAISFVTNTDWQAYSGESTLSYFTQMSALTVQNFLSAATSMSVLMAFTRGLQRRESTGLGNFWVDMVRGTLYILLPLSFVFALLLISQGVIQNIKPYQTVSSIQKNKSEKTTQTVQTIPMGPVASQVAIKQLGTNGGGFFNTNSAHPFENPTPFSNFLELVAILMIPAALCYTYGVMVKKTRQGWAILGTMLLIFIPLLFITVIVEENTNPLLKTFGENVISLHGGNLEGKETRFGSANSAIWAAAATATGNGSVNSMLDSFLPIGGLIPLWLIDFAEIIFGGVGSGLYQMLLFLIITVFVCGLMVGRTPEYLGKKIEAYEMKMASFAILVMPLTVLFLTALALMTAEGAAGISNPGMHGLSEVLYAFSSMTNNNGSAFAGLNANTPFYNMAGGIVMLIGRYWILIPALAIAGSLVQKKVIPKSSGTLPTDGLFFMVVLALVVLIIGALTFFPVLSLGPIVEHYKMVGG